MREELLQKINEDRSKGLTMYQLAKLMDMKYDTLYNLVTLRRVGTVTSWEQIAKYYYHRRRK